MPGLVRRRNTEGMSLAGLLVIVVVLGGLTAATIVGLNAMTGSDNGIVNGPTASTGASHGSTGGVGSVGVIAAAAAAACNAASAAATSASSAYFVTSGSYPTKWSDLTAAPAPVYVPPAGVAVDPAKPAELDGRGWQLRISGNGASEPSFSCTYARQ